MAYCEKCGKEIKEGVKFCVYCGATQENNQLGTEENNQYITNESNQSEIKEDNQFITNSQPKKKKRLLLPIVIALILVVAIGVFCFIFFFNNKEIKVKEIDEDTAVYNISYDEFRSQFPKSLFKISSLLSESDSFETEDIEEIEEIAEEFDNDENWENWEKDDCQIYNWKYTPEDYSSFEYSIKIVEDIESGKINKVQSDCYVNLSYGINSYLLNYLLYGDDFEIEQLENSFNLIQFYQGEDVYEDAKILNIDNMCVFGEYESSDFTMIFSAVTKSFDKEFDDIIIYLPKDKLNKFDKMLSSRYGYDYEKKSLIDD